MKLVHIVVLLYLSDNCLAFRQPFTFMSPMMVPFDNKPSDIDNLLSACLSKIRQSIDVIIDVDSWRSSNKGNDDPTWFVNWGHSPMASYDVADFVGSLARNIPKPNLYAVIVDGTAGNQTKYYVTAPVPTGPITTVTTPAPVTGFTQTHFNGGTMMRLWYQHSYVPVERPLPTLKQLLTKAFSSRANIEPLDFPTEKNSSAPPTMFTVIITDSTQGNSLSSLSRNNDRTVILDIGGKAAAREKSYLIRNLLVVPDSSSLNSFAQAVQFMICQAAGGNTDQLSLSEINAY